MQEEKEYLKYAISESSTFKQTADRFVLLISKYIEDHNYEIKSRYNNYISVLKDVNGDLKLRQNIYKGNALRKND